MAYLSFSELGGAAAVHADQTVCQPAPEGSEHLTSLEWSVVRIARKDGLGSLRQPGRFTNFLRALFRQPNPMLADARLERLRRVAVLTWHYGYTVPSHEVRALLAAGFTPRQYETLVDGISAAKFIPVRATAA